MVRLFFFSNSEIFRFCRCRTAQPKVEQHANNSIYACYCYETFVKITNQFKMKYSDSELEISYETFPFLNKILI